MASTVVLRRKAPVFILGSPRSGTTLLYHMFLSSGDFAVYRSESNVFSVWEPRFGDLGDLKNKQRLLKVWLQSESFRRTGLDPRYIEEKLLAECRNGGDFLNIVMEEIARSQNVHRWADCTPDHLLYIRRIKRTIPDALVIHIIRDGRDVALSLEKQGWIRPFPWDTKNNLIVAGLFWEWIVSKGREYGKAIGPDYVEVRFEDLIAQPRQTLANLGEFIDHDLNYDRIQQVGIGSVSKPNTSFEMKPGNADFNPVGRWKNGFSEEGLAAFEKAIGPFLRTLGYPLASVQTDRRNNFTLKRMCALYPAYYGFKLWLKSKTPMGRLLREDLSSL